MRLPIQVEAILFRNNEGEIEFLILKRKKERGGFWQPITGGLEDDETLIEALRREIKEETGITNYERIIENVHYFEFSDSSLVESYKTDIFSEYVFGIEVSSNEELVLDEKEHCEYRWCSFIEALKLLKWKENKEALKKLKELLSKQR